MLRNLTVQFVALLDGLLNLWALSDAVNPSFDGGVLCYIEPGKAIRGCPWIDRDISNCVVLSCKVVVLGELPLHDAKNTLDFATEAVDGEFRLFSVTSEEAKLTHHGAERRNLEVAPLVDLSARTRVLGIEVGGTCGSLVLGKILKDSDRFENGERSLAGSGRGVIVNYGRNLVVWRDLRNPGLN